MKDPLSSLSQHIEPGKLPPVEKWNPPFCGDLPIRIDREGRWFYQESPIGREALVKLFSSILWREGDDYFLVTPVEKVRIQVEVAPFVVVAVEQIPEQGGPVLRFTDKLGQVIVAGKEHPIWVAQQLDGQPIPMIMLRRNLPALIHRNVFYQLVEWAEASGEQLILQSGGESFSLGKWN